MSTFEIIVIVALFVVLGIILYYFVISQVTLNQGPSQNLFPIQEPVPFMFRCSQDLTCAEGLTCDPNLGICKKNDGTQCNSDGECLTNSLCSGICVSGQPAYRTGTPLDPCPCPSNMTCSSKTLGSVELACKLNPDEPCQTDQECLSGECKPDNTCSGGVQDGLPCSVDTDCVQGSYCSIGICQPRNGQACSTDSDCGPGATCQNQICNPSPAVTGQLGSFCIASDCNPGFSCIGGICSPTESSLGLGCTVNQDCADPLLCYDVSNRLPCTSSSEGCWCQYNFDNAQPNPNGCQTSSLCISNYVCDMSDVCTGPNLQPCSTGADCISSNCGGSGGIYYATYVYDIDQKESSSPSAIQGSYDIIWTKISSGTVPNIVKRLTCDTSNVYYVSPGSSLDPSGTGVVKSDGSNIVLGYFVDGADTYTLIDAVMYEDQKGLVAFKKNADYVLFTYDSGNLTPFNGGIQISDSNPLTIENIDRSTVGDVLIQDLTGEVYVKQSALTNYKKAGLGTQSTLPRFYYDIGRSQTVPSCSDCPSDGKCTTSGGVSTCTIDFPSYENLSFVFVFGAFGQLLQFKGNAQGAKYPIYAPDSYDVYDQAIYSDPDSGLLSGVAFILATNMINAEKTLFAISSIGTQPLPVHVNGQSRIAVGDRLYLFSESSCS